MPVNGLRIAITIAALLGVTLGCHGVPPIPEHVRARGYTDETSEEGWLFQKLTGQQQAAAESDRGAAVKQASAEEPLIGPVPPSGKGYVVDEVEKSDDGFSLEDLSPENVYKKMKKLGGKGPNEGVARALYEEGQELYKQKKYDEAAGKFKAAADRWPDSTLEEDALFMLGESYFFADRYPKANDAYGTLLKKYEYTRHLDTSVARLFAIGRYWEELSERRSFWKFPVNLTDKEQPWFDTFGYGIKAFETVRLYDPTGPLADDSVMAAANAYFVHGRFEEAAFHYDLIRTDYPKSEHQINAHVLGMKSKLQTYQGPLYEGTPLKDAQKIADQALTQFGRELGAERKYVLDTRNRVTEELAAREWAIGQYYDKRQYYRAARYYYQGILDEYPRSAVAQKAEKRIQEIAGLPDVPPNRFKWLTDVFSVKD